jgi:pimeloyl-ACP methyl ester carboxylesterase
VAQLASIREWGTISATGRYSRLKDITRPTLIVHGNQDIVVAPINSLILAERLPNAHLVVAPIRVTEPNISMHTCSWST